MTQQIIDRGIRAKLLLEDETLKEALAAMHADIVRMWEECPARDEEGRLALWQLKKTATKFEQCLRGYVEQGEFDAEKMRRIDKPRLVDKLRNMRA